MNTIAPHRLAPPVAAWLEQMIMAAPKGARLPDAGDLAGLSARVMQDMAGAQAGMAAWRAHAYRHNYGPRRKVWSAGTTRIYDYGGSGVPVLVVPSLINSAEILDLGVGASFMAALRGHGFWPLLLDWQAPGADESRFSTGDYVTKRLLPALSVVRQHSGQNPALVGHCVGGTLAVAAAQLDGNIRALATLGAPWVFPRRDGPVGTLQGADPAGLVAMLRALAAPDNTLPGAFFQTLFALLTRSRTGQRFARFADLPPDSPEATRFVAVQDWLNTGPPVAIGAASQMLVDWHVQNQIVNGGWQVGGTPIDATTLATPTLCICGRFDSVTPLESARPLGQLIPDAQALTPDAGHISMLIGPQATNQTIAPIAKFFLDFA